MSFGWSTVVPQWYGWEVPFQFSFRLHVNKFQINYIYTTSVSITFTGVLYGSPYRKARAKMAHEKMAQLNK